MKPPPKRPQHLFFVWSLLGLGIASFMNSMFCLIENATTEPAPHDHQLLTLYGLVGFAFLMQAAHIYQSHDQSGEIRDS
jgi:hypothetical protein